MVKPSIVTPVTLSTCTLTTDSLTAAQTVSEPPSATAGTVAPPSSFGSSNAPSCTTITSAAPPSPAYVAPAMFEPPVAASFTTAVRSNGLPETGSVGDAATSDTTGACTSVTVAVEVANVSFSPV